MTKRNFVRQLHAISVPSTELLSDPRFIVSEGVAVIDFDHETGGQVVSESVSFQKPRAFRQLAETLCRAWHADAYDHVSLVENSDWVRELRKQESENGAGGFVMNHYMIYFDGAGVFEVVADAYTLSSDA